MKYRVLLFMLVLACLSALPLSSPTIQSHAATRPLQAHATPLIGSWTTTGSMSTTRAYATATLLTTGPHAGDVLVAGGESNGNTTILSSAELYDPATGSWSATGSMHTARYGHTATLLPNGQVLVAGGFGPGERPGENNVLSSAELYDPATGSWSATGSMSAAREFHTTTLLHNGQVLVAGGEGNTTTAINSAELYNPATGSWSATGPMSTARVFHTATSLNNGQVLVAGGRNSAGTDLNSAELYNPTSGTWSSTSSMSAARWQHTATLLQNGQVLVAGGRNSAGVSINSAELYNSTSGTWSSTGSMSTARDSYTATLLHNGLVLVAGGEGSTNAVLSSAELYNSTSGTWSSTSSMHAARALHTATLLSNGQVLVAGGYNLASAEVFAFAPQLNLPANITVDASGPNGAIVNYAATIKPDGVKMNYAVTATDPNSGKPLPVTCTPPSGSTFPIGTTTVTCSAKLPPPSSLVTSGSFTITVEGAPILHLPANITVDATGPTGAAVTYIATATDPNTGKSIPVTCTPPSGSTFPIGITTVQCSAQKSPTLVTKGHFTITVEGAPILHLPANITVNATSPHGAVVTYSATATDPNTGKSIPVTCTPASGSTFAIGTTTVQCSAQKSPTLVTRGSFTVTVKGVADQIKALIALVKSFKFNFLVQETLNVHLQVALVGVKGHLDILARSQLISFIAQVRAYQVTGQLSASQASQLIAAAQQIQNVLG